MDLAASESGVARMIALILLTSYTSDFAEEELDDLAADLEIHDVINSTAHSVDGQTLIRTAVLQLDVAVLVTPDDGGLLDDRDAGRDYWCYDCGIWDMCRRSKRRRSMSEIGDTDDRRHGRRCRSPGAMCRH